MTLKTYKSKRNFKKTPEPSGLKTIDKKNKKLVYLIQKHAATRLHYDFRLELNGVLLSWAVPKGPCLDPTVKRLAVHVEDHPLEYGKFEGVIPKTEYGGGEVMLWDTGYWISDDESPSKAYQNGAMHFQLQGKKLKGKWRLFRINKDDKTWLLQKADDEFAIPLQEYDVLVEMPKSVVSQRRIDQIGKDNFLDNLHLAKSKMPTSINPQLAMLVETPPNGKNWYHEIKFDGYRILAFKTAKTTKTITRNNHDWTNKFKTVADEVNRLPIKNVIFDGEVVVLDDKQHSNFQLLQNSIKQNQGRPFIYYIFDILYYDQYNLMHLPLSERKKILQTLITPYLSETLRYSDHIIGSGKKIFQKMCEMSLEGIVSKDANSPYLQRRAKNWQKIKCIKRQEFVIGGYTTPGGARKYFGALLLGTYQNKKLIYNGNVGTGFTEKSSKAIYAMLENLQTKTLPFSQLPPNSKNVTWVKPKLVCEVEFTEWTEEGYLRHPSFKGLREDKPALEIRKEISMPKQSTIKITNTDKELYPNENITKGDLINYYETIQKWILPYIIERPISLLRCPNSIAHCFFQKHSNETTPKTLHTIRIKEKHAKEPYIYIDNKEGLITLAQMAALELHTWNSTIDDIEHPDMIIFDLDPAPDVAWKKVVYAAQEIKKILEEINLKSFVKTTGGKGLHVVAPIKPKHNWDEIKQFCHVVAQYMVMQNPKEYVAQMTKAKRTGKIYIDYLRNQRGATSIAPYSTRAREGAPVATPISWDELTSNREDTNFTIQTLPERLANLKKDPWKEFFKVKQDLILDKFKS